MSAAQPSTPLVQVTRGGIVESVHDGHVVAVDATGTVRAFAGDPQVYTFIRSAAKPVQALALVESGAADHYRLSPADLALCCASHAGEQKHREAARSMLARAGLEEDALQCGPHMPRHAESAAELARNDRKPTAVYSNCSGKHTGMLLTCVHNGWDTSSYTALAHPLQQRILDDLAAVAGVSRDDIGLGTDGCGVPTHAMPLTSMAAVYARLVEPLEFGNTRASALSRLAAAMEQHPDMVSGTGTFVDELVRIGGGRLIAKTGAEGVIIIGVKAGHAVNVVGRPALGVAVKAADGNARAVRPAIVEALDQLGVLTDEQLRALAAWHRPIVQNFAETIVGGLESIMTLAFV